MQKTIIIALITLAIGISIGYSVAPAKAPQDTIVHTMPDTMASMAAGLEGKTGDAFDQAFLSEMIVHHEGAVEMAKLALQNAKHQEIKDLAQDIITAQNKEISEMKDWQKSWYKQL